MEKTIEVTAPVNPDVHYIEDQTITQLAAYIWDIIVEEWTKAIAGTPKTILSTPGAGAAATWTVPTGKKWQVKSIALTLTTDTTAAERQVYASVTDASDNICLSICTSYSQIPTSIKGYTFGTNLPNALTDLPGVSDMAWITTGFPEFSMAAGFTLNITAFNFVSGDEFSACVLTVEEFDL